MNPYRKFLYSVLPWIGFALVLNIARLWLAETSSYVYMNWNLFLGLLPILFAWLLEYKSRFKALSILYFFAWLFFLPNAPYMITDFIHLRDVGTDAMLWYDGFMIFAYALIGVYAFAFSLNRIMKFLKQSHTFIFIISLVSAFGIYLGRYIRWNTWNIITHPLEFSANIFNVIGSAGGNQTLILTVLVFTFGMMVMVYSYRGIMKK